MKLMLGKIAYDISEGLKDGANSFFYLTKKWNRDYFKKCFLTNSPQTNPS